MKTRNRIFYGLGMIPLVYISTIVIFFIKANLIDGYGNISSINPYEYEYYNLFSNAISLSLISFFFGFIIWFIYIIILFQNPQATDRKPIIISGIFYFVGLCVLFSPLMEFAAA